MAEMNDSGVGESTDVPRLVSLLDGDDEAVGRTAAGRLVELAAVEAGVNPGVAQFMKTSPDVPLEKIKRWCRAKPETAYRRLVETVRQSLQVLGHDKKDRRNDGPDAAGVFARLKPPPFLDSGHAVPELPVEGEDEEGDG